MKIMLLEDIRVRTFNERIWIEKSLQGLREKKASGSKHSIHSHLLTMICYINNNLQLTPRLTLSILWTNQYSHSSSIWFHHESLSIQYYFIILPSSLTFIQLLLKVWCFNELKGVIIKQTQNGSNGKEMERRVFLALDGDSFPSSFLLPLMDENRGCLLDLKRKKSFLPLKEFSLHLILALSLKVPHHLTWWGRNEEEQRSEWEESSCCNFSKKILSFFPLNPEERRRYG